MQNEIVETVTITHDEQNEDNGQIDDEADNNERPHRNGKRIVE